MSAKKVIKRGVWRFPRAGGGGGALLVTQSEGPGSINTGIVLSPRLGPSCRELELAFQCALGTLLAMGGGAGRDGVPPPGPY